MDTFIVGQDTGKNHSARVEKSMFLPKVWLSDCGDFTIYAISVLSFGGSVCAPDKATLKAENHALQCTTAGPYNAVPSTLLGVGLVGIHSISLAAPYRVGACSTWLSQGP